MATESSKTTVMLTTTPTMGWHVPVLAGKLRQADKDEIEAASGLDPFSGLAQSAALSDVSYTILEGAEPVGMFGASAIQGGRGAVWMLASDALERHSIQFLRSSAGYLDSLHEETGCPVLFNYTDKRNELHHKWLRWTGFEFGPEVPLGPKSMPFYTITRVKR